MGYRHIVPGPIRDGLHNAFANLDEPVVFLNFLIQHKVGKAAETVGRFAVNTTLGAAGLFD
ncbi:MlaA family lipoprotein, partial [Acinetobacter nosocomialis]